MTQEQWQLKRFTELQAIVGEFEFSDSPDLLVKTETHVLGIEHTRLLQPRQPGSDLRALESIMNRAIYRAQGILNSVYPSGLHISVYVDSKVSVTSNDIRSIAQDLADAVQIAKPQSDGEVRIDRWQFRRAKLPFPKGVTSIWIVQNRNLNESFWAPAWSCFLPRLELSIVLAAIIRKEKRLEDYRQKCDEVWLVLVVENFSPSGAWDLEDFPFDHLFQTEFDRLFLYRVFSAGVHELKKAA